MLIIIIKVFFVSLAINLDLTMIFTFIFVKNHSAYI